MPNHCDNSLTVLGSEGRIRDFARDHYRAPENWDGGFNEGKTTLDFSFSVPYPTDMNERRAGAVSSNSGWYDWHCDNWGTKWNAYDIYPESFPAILDEIEGSKDLTYSFNTAWAPPLTWLYEASKRYPLLTFVLAYREDGMDFAGVCGVRAGKIVADTEYEPSKLLDEGERELLEEEETWEEGWELINERSHEIINTFFEENDLTSASALV